MIPSDLPPLVSIHEAAKFLKVSTKTLRRWEDRHILLPARTSGGHRRYDLNEIKAFKKQKYSSGSVVHQTVLPLATVKPLESKVVDQTDILQVSKPLIIKPIDHFPLKTPKVTAYKPFPETITKVKKTFEFPSFQVRNNIPPQVEIPTEKITDFPIPTTPPSWVSVSIVLAFFFISAAAFSIQGFFKPLVAKHPVLSEIAYSLEKRLAINVFPKKEVMIVQANDSKVLGEHSSLDFLKFNINVESSFREFANFLSDVNVEGNATVSGILSVNSGSLQTTSETAQVFENASTLSIAANTGTTTVNNSLNVGGNLTVIGLINDIAGTLNLSGNTLTSTGDLVIDPGGGGVSIGDATPGIIDMTDGDFFVSGDVEIDGILYAPTANISGTASIGTVLVNSDSINDFTGTGLTVSDGALQTTIGTSVSSSEIENDTILEEDLKVSNDAVNGYALTYDNSTGGFTWTDIASSQVWIDGGSVYYQATTTDDVVIGGTSSLGKLSVDGDSDEIQLVVQGNGTQTSNIFVVEDSSGTDLFVVNNTGSITIASGQDLTIGSIGLNDVGTDNVTSGASLIGVFDEFTNSSATTLQDVLDDFDAAIGGGASKWAQDTGFVYLASTTDDIVVGGDTIANGSLYFDESAGSLYLGTNEALNGSLTLYSSGAGITDPTITADATGNANITTSATALVNILAGNLKVGNGAPTQTLNGEDAYVEGTLEVDGILYAGSATTALTVASGLIDADAIALTPTTEGLSGISSGSGLAVYSDTLSLLQGCGDGQVLKWNETNDSWECANDTGASFAVVNIENNDVAVGSNVDSIDFSTDFLVTASPSNEANVAIADDILNFTEFSDALTLDAATTITNSLAGNLTIDLTSTGDFVIADGGVAFFTFTDGGALTQAGSGQITLTGNVDATNGLDITGASLTVGGANATITTGGALTLASTITAATDETINGVDINAGTVSDVVNLTINSGGDLTIGSIGLNDVGSDNITSGASLVGVFDEFTNSSATTVQDVLDDLDAAIGAGASKWTDSGTVTYLTDTTDSITIGSSTELGKLAVDGDADEVQLLVQGNGTQTNALAIFEDSTGADQFSISNTGNVTLAGDLTISGGNITSATTFDSTATVTGTLTANGTLDANGIFTLGDNGETGAIDTSDWDISATGVLTGVSGITTDGGYTQSGATGNTFSGNVDATSGLDVTGASLTVGGANATITTGGALTLASTITANTDETVNGVDINAGTVSDVVNLTINSGGDLTIGSIGLNDIGSDNITSGASLVGVFDEFTNSDGLNVQDVLDDFDAAIGAGSSKWTDSGTVTYLTSTTDDLAVGGSTVLASMFGIDESAGNFYFGYDNSVSPTFNFEASDGDAGEFGFNTNDTFFFSNARVGVGTTNPSRLLHVSDSSGSPAIRVTGSASGSPFIEFEQSGNVRGVFGYDNTTSTLQLAYGANFSTTFLSLNSSGSMGLGTSAPDAALEINHATGDSLRLTYNDSNGSATSYTDFSLASDGDLTIDSAGGAINLGANDDLNITASTDLIFGGSTSLGESTGAADSGAFLTGIFDEFDNSASSTVQDVIDDIDAAIGNRTYTADNYVTDGQTLTASINALDIALASVSGGAYTGWSIDVDDDGADPIASGATLNVDAGSNVSLTYTAGTNTLLIAATDTNTTYTAGNDLDLTGTVFSLETTLDFVDTINLAGTGTLNGLDAVDATGENTIEALIFDTDAESITGVWTVADSTNFRIGTGGDLTFAHDGSNSTITSTTGDLLIDNTNATGSTIFDLGTDTSATDFLIRNDSGTQLLSLNGAGALQLGSNGQDGQFILYNELGVTDYTNTINPSGSQSQNITYTLPPDDGGADNYVLTTDGNGVLQWESVTGAGGGSGDLTDIIAGNYIDVQNAGGPSPTVDFDPTELEGVTWGASSGASEPFTWTYDVTNSGTDPSITFADNAITLTAATLTASGDLTIQGGDATLGMAGTDGSLTFYNELGATDRSVIFNVSGSQSEDIVYTLPPDNGAADNYVLTTDGSGVLQWESVSGAGGGTGDVTDIVAGNYIDVQNAGGPSPTVDFDPTELESVTWGAQTGASFTWTFNASSGTDTSIAFADGSISPTLAATGLFNVLTGNLKVGNGTPGLSLDGEDAYIEGTFEVDGASQFDGALTTNGTLTANGQFTLGDNGDTGAINTSDWDISTTGSLTGISGIANDGSYTQTGSSANAFTGVTTFNTDVDFTFADTENIAITNTVTGTNGLDLISAIITNQTSSGTQRGIVISNANDAANASTESLIFLDNAETTASTLTDAILITSSGADGGIVDAIDVSAGNITNALNVGGNNIIGTTAVINFDNFDIDGSGNLVTAGTLTAATNETINGVDINAGTVSDVVNLTINSGGDLTIGSIGLNDVGSDNITSGASLVGMFDEFDNSASTTVQDVIDDIDAAIGNRTYTADNYVTDGQSLTASIDALDVALAAVSGGAYTGWDLDGDSGTAETIANGNTVNILGGTNGIDTVVSATDTLTINLDTTEIGTSTFGSGSGFTWTFDAGATDPTLAFASNAITIGGAATLNFGGTLDLGTNTLSDGNFNGNWAFNSGNLSGIGTIGASGAITAATDETINGVDINAGTVSDVVNLTINSGGDLTIGSIGLNDIGSDNITSGASLVGVFDEFTNSDGLNVQDVLDDFDAAIGAGSSKWTDSGTVTYLTSTTDDLAVGGSTVLASMFGIDESAGNFYFGYDNSVSPTFNFEASDGDAGEFGFNTSDSFFFSNALVGIGTASPSEQLEVGGNIELTAAVPRLAFDNTNGDNDWYIQASATGFQFRNSSDNVNYLLINQTGLVSIGGDDSPDYLLELYDATATPTFALSDDDVTHGLTTLAQTDVFSHLTSLSTTAGGAELTTISDTDAQALSIRGVIGSTDPTDTTPAVKLVGAKSNGTTGMADLGAAETVFQVANNDDASALTILGNGNVGIGDTTPAALLTVGTSDALQIDASGNVVTTGTVTAATNETINGVDISAGTVSDVVNLTINSGGDLTIGSIGLNDVGSDNITSGASLVGVFDEFTNSSATTVQDVLDDLDAAIGAGASKWTDGGAITYLTATTDDLAVGASNTLTAPFSVDVSANLVRIGTGSTANAQLDMYASDGDTGSLIYNTSDQFNFTGGDVLIGQALTVTGTTTANGAFDANGQFDLGDGGDAGTISATTLDIDATGALQINSSGGAIGIGNDAVAQAINIGTGAAARTITMGNNTGASALQLTSGTGDITLTSTDDILFTPTDDMLATFAAGSAFTIDAATTDTTVTGGVLALDVDAGNAAVIGIDLDFSQSSGATTGTDAIGQNIAVSANDADGDVFGLSIRSNATANAGVGSYEALIRLINAEDTASAVTDAILIDSTSGVDGDIIDAIDVSDANITNALNVGANNIIGTSAVINFSSFDVDASGNTIIGGTLDVTGISTLVGNLNANGGLDVDNAFVVADGGVLTTSQTANFDGTADFDGAADFSAGVTNSAGEFLVSGGNLQLNDNINLTVGTGDDLTIVHNGTNTLLTSVTGDLIFDNTLVTGSTIFDLGTDTSATDFLIRNNSGTQLLSMNGAGAFQLGSNGQDGQFILYNELGGTDYTNTINPSGSQSQNITYTLPPDDGGLNYVLTSDGSGVLTWQSVGGIGAGGDLTDIVAGNYIDVQNATGPSPTIDFDPTELETVTWGAQAGSSFAWTFNASSGTDPVMTFADNAITLTAATTTLSGDLAINGGNVTTATTFDSTLTATGTLTANGALDANGQFDLGDGGDAGTISATTLDIDATGALQINSSGGAIGIGNDAVAQAINIGTGAAARTITVGNNTGASALQLTSGTGDINLNSADDIFLSPSDDLTAFITAVGQFTIDAATIDSQNTLGAFRLDIDSSTSGTIGFLTNFRAIDDDAADILYANRTDVTIQDDTTASDTVYGNYISLIQNDTTPATTYGLAVVAEDAGTSPVSTGILIENLQATDIDLTDGLLIRATTDGSLVDAIDASDAEITNALNIGANTILGTTGVIDFTNFDVAATGALSLSTAGNTSASFTRTSAGQWMAFNDGTDTWGIYNTAGSPEASLTANTGALAMDTTNGTLYVKTDDGDNTGWVNLASGASSPWTDSGTTSYLTDTTDEVVIGGASPLSSAKFSIDGDADQTQLLVQGNATQTTDLAIFENSAGADQFNFSNTGNLIAAGDITATGGTFNGASGESIDLGVASSDVLTFTTGASTELLLSTTNLTAGTAEGNSLGSATVEWEQLFLGDNNGISFGLDQDWSFGYDEATDDRLELITAGTSGMLIQSATATGNGLALTFDSLSTGEGLYLSSTSTALTSGGHLGLFEWNPGSASSTTADLFSINIGSNATVLGDIFNVQDNGSDLFSVGEAQITSALPHSFTAAGDVSVAYDLQFTNQTASYLKTYGPLQIEAGESFESNNLTIKTYNSGDVVIDLPATGQMIVQGAFSIGDQQTLPAGTTPSVAGGSHYIGNANGLITNFTSGTAGQILVLEFDGTSTDLDCSTAGPIRCGSTDITTQQAAGDIITFIYDGTNWNMIEYVALDADSTAGADLAEYYPASEHLEPGDIVSIDSTQPVMVEKSHESHRQRIMGIVSSDPGLLLGEEADNSYPIALAGRVHVKMSESSEAIQPGDLVGVSQETGKAKKVNSGYTVGRALESWDPNSGDRDVVVFVNLSYIPVDLALNNDGQVSSSYSLITTDSLEYAIRDLNNGQDIQQTLVLAESLIGRLETGSIVTRELQAQSIETEDFLTNNATVSGQLNANSAEINSLRFETATVAGQLFLSDGRSVGSLLDENDAYLASLSAQTQQLAQSFSEQTVPGTSTAFDEFLAQLTGTEDASLSAALAAIQNQEDIELDAESMVLAPDAVFVKEYLNVTGFTQLTTASISQSLTVGDGLLLTQDTIATAEETLYIQPTAGSLNLLAGLMTLTPDGNVTINGDLTVTGIASITDGVKTSQLSPNDFTQDLTVKLASESASVLGTTDSSEFQILNASNSAVASIDASGSAKFSSISTEGLVLKQPQSEASSSAQRQAEIARKQTAGQLTLEAGEVTMEIENDNVEDDSLIYLTATSDTQNQVMYVGEKETCAFAGPTCQTSFTVKINQPIATDIKFNFWIVNVSKQQP